MSVINKMLQDLDKRQQGHQLSNITPQQMHYVGRSGQSKKGLLISVASLLLGALSVYAFQTINQQELTSETPSAGVNQETYVEAIAPNHDLSQDAKTAVQANLVPQSEPEPELEPELELEPEPQLEPQPQSVATTELASTDTVPVPDAAAQVLETDTELGLETETPSHFVDEKTLTPEPTPDPIAEPVKSTGQMAVTEVRLTPTQLAQKQLTMATDAEKQGNWSKAIEHYGKALNLDPSLPEARKQLAALYYGQGQLHNAAQVLQQGWLLYPQEFELALLLARVQQAMGNTDLALTSLANIPDSHVLARQKWLAQSDLAQKQGQFALAEQAYRQLLQQEPQQAKWWMGLGYALDSQQQFVQASQAYRSALSHPGLSTQASAFIEQRLNQLGDSQ